MRIGARLRFGKRLDGPIPLAPRPACRIGAGLGQRGDAHRIAARRRDAARRHSRRRHCCRARTGSASRAARRKRRTASASAAPCPLHQARFLRCRPRSPLLRRRASAAAVRIGRLIGRALAQKCSPDATSSTGRPPPPRRARFRRRTRRSRSRRCPTCGRNWLRRCPASQSSTSPICGTKLERRRFEVVAPFPPVAKRSAVDAVPAANTSPVDSGMRRIDQQHRRSGDRRIIDELEARPLPPRPAPSC